MEVIYGTLEDSRCCMQYWHLKDHSNEQSRLVALRERFFMRCRPYSAECYLVQKRQEYTRQPRVQADRPPILVPAYKVTEWYS